jgi:hypothetical protein
MACSATLVSRQQTKLRCKHTTRHQDENSSGKLISEINIYVWQKKMNTTHQTTQNIYQKCLHQLLLKIRQPVTTSDESPYTFSAEQQDSLIDPSAGQAFVEYALKHNPTFTGTVTLPEVDQLSNDNAAATTSFCETLVGNKKPPSSTTPLLHSTPSMS